MRGLGGDDFVDPGWYGNDKAYGGAGDRLYPGPAGEDQYFGGPGIDEVTFSYFVLSGGVTASLSTGVASGPDGTVTMSGVENLSGSWGDDRLEGRPGPNEVRGGGGGDDTITVVDGVNGNESPMVKTVRIRATPIQVMSFLGASYPSYQEEFG